MALVTFSNGIKRSYLLLMLGTFGIMNTSYPPIHMINLPPVFIQVGQELPKALAYLLIPAKLLYFAIYFKIKGNLRLFESLTFLCVIAFWLAPIVTPLSCGLFKSLQNFASIILTSPSYNIRF
jgi:hypothetical protein